MYYFSDNCLKKKQKSSFKYTFEKSIAKKLMYFL